MHCKECGAPLSKPMEEGSTRMYKCPECFTERVQYIEEIPCKHEYVDKNGNKCIHCGEPSIHYAE